MMHRTGIVFSLLLLVHILRGQTAIHIQGYVRDAYGRSGLSQSQLIFSSDLNNTFNAITDTAGYFEINNINPGRYDVRINAKSYQSQLIKDYLIGRTNVTMLFELVPLSTDLPEVVITDRKNGIYLHPLSNALEVTREETERLPAGFFDPARLFTSQSGVSSFNDGANHLIIRGNNPAFVKWMIHGTEILNPNHLSNAGTLSDQASPSGGGVNMISASVLDNTYLYKNPAPATIGNALAGSIDLNLRNGNTGKLTTEAQISLLGMELGLEGPLSSSGASFVARYRYSTVGLLSQFGVKFGDESINYQDVMARASFPMKKKDLSFFLFTGNNVNDYAGLKDSTKRTIDKETMDIKFKGGQLIAGMTYETKSNPKGRFLTDVIYSENNTSRRTIEIDHPILDFENRVTYQKTNFHPRYIAILGENKVLTSGMQLQLNKDNITFLSKNIPTTDIHDTRQYITAQPYSNYLIESGKFTYQMGLHSLITTSSASLEPRFQIALQSNEYNSLHINLGKYSQAYHQAFSVLLMKSVQAQIGYQHQTAKTLWRLEGYVQHHYDIPSFGNYSLISESPSQDASPHPLNFPSKGNVIGMETDLGGSLGKWRYNTNLSLFHSTFTNSLKTGYSSRFDQTYLFHASIGREWEKQKTKYKKIFGWYSAIQSGGAMKDTPIDLVNGIPTIRTNDLYSITRPALTRLDMRIYRRKFFKNINTMLALDIQNLTGQQNFSYSYYDYTKKAVTINYQLGILPNLSFTIEY